MFQDCPITGGGFVAVVVVIFSSSPFSILIFFDSTSSGLFSLSSIPFTDSKPSTSAGEMAMVGESVEVFNMDELRLLLESLSRITRRPRFKSSLESLMKIICNVYQG
jgi:hypothetical protein